MQTKSLIILILVILLAATAGVFLFLKSKPPITIEQPKTINIQDQQINDNTKPFVIKIVYPQIAGLDDFNQKVKAIIDKELADFKKNSLANDEAVKQIDPKGYAVAPREYDLNIGYDKGEIDNNIVSVIFNVYNFEGGAHGASYFVPLNYNLQYKNNIKLSDLFSETPDYLQKISDYCIKDLIKQITVALGSTDGTWIQDGAGPKEENFLYFLINKDNIVFYFPQYQVAYGAAGDFKVTMPR